MKIIDKNYEITEAQSFTCASANHIIQCNEIMHDERDLNNLNHSFCEQSNINLISLLFVKFLLTTCYVCHIATYYRKDNY